MGDGFVAVVYNAGYVSQLAYGTTMWHIYSRLFSDHYAWFLKQTGNDSCKLTSIEK